jgi:uncharacterized protein (TIGR02145 family)
MNVSRPLLGFLTGCLTLLLPVPDLSAQVAGFLSPDTVCTGELITLTNTTVGGTTWYWNFCSGNANQNPSGLNIGNPGNLLDIPTYLTLVKQGNDCFSFISCQGVGVVRYFHGTSFKNNPVSWTNLGTFGAISFSQEGIQVKEDNGQWYGIVCSDTKLVRLNFGASLWNTPTATNLTFAGLNMLHGLVVIKEGTTWLGFATCSTGNKLVRFNFGTSLGNVPVMTDFGNLAGFSSPGALCLVQENTLWYGMMMAGGNTLARITFGNSLLNTPTGVNLGNPGGFSSAIGLTLIRDCESTVGYWVNYLSPGQLGKLVFPTGITGSVTGTVLGNIGSLAQPHSFSEIFRQNDTLYAYITNRQNGTLTRLTFPPCSNASVPSSTMFNPPAFSYNTAGTYNIRLIVNEGLPNQSTICKSIVVLAAPCNPVAAFTAPDTVCVGSTVNITNQSTTGATYYWSFCSGNALSNPLGVNIGNPGNLLNIPGYSTLVKDASGTCYSFITNQGTMSVVRYNHGTSFSNNPVSWTNLGGFGMLSDTVLGIKIKYDNGQWIGFVNNNNRIVRLNFGASLGNAPTATLLGPYAMLNTAHCIDIFKEGATWFGYITCSWGNKLVRLNFGNSLLNTPVLTDLGIPGAMNLPASFRFINENGTWYGLVANFGNNTMTRLTFGSSLLNDPTGVNLGVVCPGIITPGGITLIRDCGGTTGFQLNYSTSSPDLIWRLSFPSGITGPVTGTSLGNIGAMNRPSMFSELFRVGDTLFLYATNRQNFTLTRLRFLPCSNASVPSSTLYNPPAFSYNQPGTYNIQLIVNEGLPDQATLCKSIVVLAAPCNAAAAFTAPDTVCVGTPINVINTSTGGTSYYWNFCSGSASANPAGINIGNPGNALNQPVYNTLVQDGTDCYSFVTNHGSPTHITRNYHGNSFRNNPVSSTIILQNGIIHQYCEAIQIRKENGNWYGFVNNNTTIHRINFGASITNNSPTTTDIGPFPNIAVAHGLVIVKEGTTWLGFFDSSDQNKLYRLNFGTSLANIPVFSDLGNLAGFSHPCQIASVKENGTCYLLIVNFDGNSLSRVNFGTSYLNTPTGQNLGNCGAMVAPIGITVLNDCETTTAYYTEYLPSATTTLGKLTFSGGIGGTVTAQSLGNIGTLHYPVGFSELFRQNDSLFAYVANQYSSSLTRFSFPPCNNASIPSSTLFTPPAFSYNAPGTYPVRLVVNEGQYTEASVCHSIVVMPQQIVNLGNDRSICPGTTTILDAGAGFTSYLWSTGATSRMITVGTAGSYWAKGTKYGCEDYDTVVVSVYPFTPVNLGPDPTVCDGQTVTFDAGTCWNCNYLWSNLTTGQTNIGTGQTYTTGNAGIYSVLLTSTDGCISRDTIQLFTNPTPTVTNWPLFQSICSNNHVIINLTSGIPGSNFAWTVTASSPDVTGWSNGVGLSINQLLLNTSAIDQTVTYHITPFIGSCSGPVVDYIVTVKPVPDVSASPPSQSVCNGASVTISLSSGISSASFTWSASGSPPAISGFYSGFGPNIIQPLYNSGQTIGTVTYQITPIANGCPGTPLVYNVPVMPQPDVVINPPAQIICSGNSTTIALTASSALTTFSWTASLSSGNITGYSGGSGDTISQLLTNPAFTPGSINYSITAEISGCLFPPVICPVTVNPSPSITNSGIVSEMCSGAYTSFTPVSTVAGTLFSWTAVGNSPDLTGYIPGNGNSITQQLFNSGFTNPSVIYTVTPYALGCSGAPGIFTAIVHPIPDINFSPASTTVCTGDPVSIQLNSQAQPALFTWTATGSSAFITNYSGGTGPAIQQVPQNTGPDPETVTYTVTPASNGCSGVPVPYIANINPRPVLTISSYPSSLCSGELFSLAFSSATTGTLFSWSASATSPSVSGYSSGNGNNLSHTLQNQGSTVESVTYLITPQANGCAGTTSTVVVYIKPKPDLIFNPDSQSVCYGQHAQIVLSSSFPGAICSWTATGSSPAVTGYTDGTGNTISQPLFTTGSTTQTVTYFLSSALDGCVSPVSQSTVLTYPVPDVTLTPSAQSVCSGQYTGITLQSQLSGTTFPWTATGSAGVAGYFNGMGNTIAQLLTNATNTQGWVNYSVTPVVSNCSGPVSSVLVNVYVNPAVSFSICSDTITTTSGKPFLLRGGLPRGGVYTGAGVDSGTGLFDPSLSGAGNFQVTYSYTNSYNCSSGITGTMHVLPDMPFICSNLLNDVRDGHQYPTYLLPNGKCWMKENLDFGLTISDSGPQTDNCMVEKYHRYSTFNNRYSSYYQWDELMRYNPVPGSQGLCPPGWHVPTSAEWDELVDFNTGPGQAGGPMKDQWLANGFHSYQQGFLYLNNSWAFTSGLYAGTMYWTSNPQGDERAMARGLNSYTPSASMYPSSRGNAFTVRCTKDL